MKNLTKALGIAGITALSFLPMGDVKGQDVKITENGFEKYNKKEQLVKKVEYLKEEFGIKEEKIRITKYKYNSKDKLKKRKEYIDFGCDDLSGTADVKGIDRYKYNNEGELENIASTLKGWTGRWGFLYKNMDIDY